MESYSTDQFLKSLLAQYRHHNLEIKELHSANCSGGIQWVWLQFGECLLHPSHVLGYWIGLLSLPLWIIGCLCGGLNISTSYRSMYSFPGRRFLCLLAATFVTDVLGLMGSVLSMQIMLLIIFGFVAVIIDILAIIFTIVAMLGIRRTIDRLQYVEVCTSTRQKKKHSVKTAAGEASSRGCCLVGGMFVTSGLIFVLLILITDQTESSLSIAKSDLMLAQDMSLAEAPDYASHVMKTLNTIGYILGCAACLCFPAVSVLGMRLEIQEQPLTDAIRLHRHPLCKDILVLMFDLLFVLGVLLQSGGLRLILTALPWIVQRLLHGSFHLFVSPQILTDKFQKLHYTWSYQANDININEEEDNDDDDDVIIDKTDSMQLLKSSESEESRVGQMYPKSVNFPDRRRSSGSSRRLSDQANPNRFWPLTVKGRPRIFSYDATSTTDSEMSSMSQIHDIELYRDRRCSIPRIIVHQSEGQSPTPRPNRLSLNGLRNSGLSDTTLESHDQRVRSWVSQHTPEEEFAAPLSLALTLNLDTSTPLNSPTSPDVDFHKRLPLLVPSPYRPCGSESAANSCRAGAGARVGHMLSALTMVPRKNSL